MITPAGLTVCSPSTFTEVMLLAAGLVPRFSALLTTIPQCVLGGATVSVFASIAMTGMKLVAMQPMSYRFEDIARSYFSRSVKSGLLKGVIDVGTYWYDDKKRHKNGEFDCAVSYGDGYDIFEVKHLSAPMDRTLADAEIRKIQEIGAMNVKHIGFVSLEGFSFTDPDYILISGKELFSPELETPACRKKHDQLG